MKVAALGRTQILYKTIKAVIAEGHEIVLIGTCPAAPEYTVTEDDFSRLAQEIGCPYFCTTSINKPECIQMIRASTAEIAISVNWLTLIGQEALDQFKYGIINAHAGNLPRFRGNAAPNWAILNGEKQVVITLHQMVAELDAGPILLQRQFSLTSETYVGDFYRFSEQNTVELFVEALSGLATGSLIPQAQPTDPHLSLRCFPRLPRDGAIDWAQPANDLARLVRASAEPFAGAYSFLGAEKLIIWRARPEQLPYPYLGTPGQVAERRPETGEVLVITGENLLALQEVETESTGRRNATEVIRSIRVRLGMDVTTEVTHLRQRVTELERLLQALTEKVDKVE